MKTRNIILITLLGSILTLATIASLIGLAGDSYLLERKAHKTVLIKKGPAPQSYSNQAPPAGVKEITYLSGNLKLKAWYATPANKTKMRNGKFPVVIYLHGGYASGIGDYEDAKTFLNAGYAILIPRYRGENGNPGHFEMFYGEVTDALNSVKWISKQPGVDESRVYVFGHSIGGGIAELTSLWPDTGIRLSASSGGLYDSNTFKHWKKNVPFEMTETEKRLRLFTENIRSVMTPHIAYYGKQDVNKKYADSITEEAKLWDVPLQLRAMPGDHFSSLRPSMQDFLKTIDKY